MNLREGWTLGSVRLRARGASAFLAGAILLILGLGLVAVDRSQSLANLDAQRLTAAQEKLVSIMASLNAPDMTPAYEAVERHRAEMTRLPNILGLSAGRTDDGRPAVLVHYERDYQPALPATIDGLPVVPLLCD